MVRYKLCITILSAVIGGMTFCSPTEAQYLEQKSNSYSIRTPEMDQDISDFVPAPSVPAPSSDTRTSQSPSPVELSDFHYVPPANSQNGGGVLKAVQTKPGIAFLSSAVVPGSGQLINHKYVRGALYLAAEATALVLHITNQREGRRQQDQYREYANNNWSVVNYAKWLVNYYENNDNISGGTALEDLRAQVNGIPSSQIPYGKEAWDVVDHSLLNQVERQTPYIYPGGRLDNNFSHSLPEYGSQQYYELISKYYQFGPGWNDFGNTRGGGQLENLYQLNWGEAAMPPNWHKGSRLAAQFNDSYRLANNMLKLMVVNHVISAFDAYFTVKIKQHKLKADATLLRGGGSLVSLNYSF